MVRGLDFFREHFAAFKDRYVLIGGTASYLVLEEAGIEFRATKDLDIVLCIAAFDREFAQAFWKFIEGGGYAQQERSDGQKVFYRFMKPADARFPAMLELFSRAPDNIRLDAPAALTPIPAGHDVDSLSAILLDEDYYAFIQTGIREIAGLPCIGAPHLIPLKAHAWLDLIARAQRGERIDSADIRKHRNDVVRLYQLLVLDQPIPLPANVLASMREFVERAAADADFEPGRIVKGLDAGAVIDGLRKVYRL